MQLLKNQSINDQISPEISEDKPHDREQIETYELEVSRLHQFSKKFCQFCQFLSCPEKVDPTANGVEAKSFVIPTAFLQFLLLLISLSLSFPLLSLLLLPS